MAFFGALLCEDRTGPVGHRVGLEWAKFWERLSTAQLPAYIGYAPKSFP